MGVWSSIYFPRADAPEMIATMDECGVRLLVFSHHHALFSPNIGNQASIQAVRQHPARLRAYCVINPNYPDIAARDVAGFEENRDVFLGFKFSTTTASRSGRYRPAWEYADRHNLLLLIHTWEGSPYDGPAVVRPMAERYPNVRLLLGHSFHADWDAAVRMARDFSNVYLELTAVFDNAGAALASAG
jgi:predicted TIM-barrel fold metal-dependent hydrolase